MGFVIKKSITYNMMDGNQLEYVFDNINLDHITFKGNGKESFSFNRALVENLIETFDTMQDIYSDNYGIKVYTGNCIIQLNVNPKNLSESFFDVYDRDGMKLIYSIQNSILKEMFIIRLPSRTYKQQHRIFSKVVLSRRTRQGKRW